MRLELLAPLFADVLRIKGVGEHLASCIARLTGRTQEGKPPRIRDLLFHLPTSIIDRRFMPPLNQAPENRVCTFEVTIDVHIPPPTGKRGQRITKLPYRVICSDGTGSITLTFFNPRGDYLTKQLPAGETRVISGKVERGTHGLQMSHPDYIVPVAQKKLVASIEPIYPLTGGVSNKQLLWIMREALSQAPALPEWCDAHWIRKQAWPSWKAAIKKAHRPESLQEIGASPARSRLAYDELLANQLALNFARQRVRKQSGTVIEEGGELIKKLEAALPFQLTQGQREVIAEVDADMRSGARMVRLLQGDVGSGKTMVALMAMARVVAAGKQAALMAPTEILARQHAATFTKLLEPLGVRVVLLTGTIGKPKDREALRVEIASGKVAMVIGTHALFQESVAFQDLGLVVVDEQHRFGVAQRMQLADKAQVPPHILLMTATPIPRTLTMTAYGDMDSSILREKPKGRQKIDTRAVMLERAPEVVEGLRRAIADGNKVYWICPLVEEQDEETADTIKDDLAAAEERYKEFKTIFGPRVGLVHGRMKPEAREPVMQGFAGDKYDILVATTVVEVGVDVPAATVMVIEHAERFGLSQLHQLRGRVGRGSKPSNCILLYRHPCGEVAEQRLRIMRETEDGFRIAEEDLRLRGAGDVLGTRQSGLVNFRFADLLRDRELVLAARDDAKLILNQDAELTSERGCALRILLYLFEYDQNIKFLRSG